jgi:hypothetical protein
MFRDFLKVPEAERDWQSLITTIAESGWDNKIPGYTGNAQDDYRTAKEGAFSSSWDRASAQKVSGIDDLTLSSISTGPGGDPLVWPAPSYDQPAGDGGFALFNDPSTYYGAQEPLGDVYSRFTSQTPYSSVPAFRSTYEAARPMAQQQFYLQQDPGLSAGLMPQESLYREFLKGQVGQPLYGTDLQKRIEEISSLISAGPQATGPSSPTEARWMQSYASPESQRALFELPFQMAAPYAGARSAYGNVIQDAFNRYMWQNPTGVTPGGQQFLPWALEQDVMGYQKLYGG